MVESITKYLPKYQRSIKKLIEEGYEIVGSARKSPSDEDEDTRIRLLQDMINNLTERSFAKRIYISANSRSSTPFFERDLKPHDSVISELKNINGNTTGNVNSQRKKNLNSKSYPSSIDYRYVGILWLRGPPNMFGVY